MSSGNREEGTPIAYVQQAPRAVNVLAEGVDLDRPSLSTTTEKPDQGE